MCTVAQHANPEPSSTLAAAAEDAPTELERSADLAGVGVASDVVPHDDAGRWVAVSARGRFTTAQTAVDYGVPRRDRGRGLGAPVTTTRIEDHRVPLVVLTDRDLDLVGPGGEPVVTPMNGCDSLVETTATDSGVQVLSVPLSAFPEPLGRIAVGVRSAGASGTVDDVGTQDAVSYAVRTPRRTPPWTPPRTPPWAARGPRWCCSARTSTGWTRQHHRAPGAPRTPVRGAPVCPGGGGSAAGH
ncbi:MAG: putative Subtilisin [Klenkia sp.]|nr:putative Subtilisin [Klenkia sp.]